MASFGNITGGQSSTSNPTQVASQTDRSKKEKREAIKRFVSRYHSYLKARNKETAKVILNLISDQYGLDENDFKRFETKLDKSLSYPIYPLTINKNLLVAGPPGTGKSFLVSVLSKKTGAIVYNIRSGDLYDPDAIAGIFEVARRTRRETIKVDFEMNIKSVDRFASIFSKVLKESLLEKGFELSEEHEKRIIEIISSLKEEQIFSLVQPLDEKETQDLHFFSSDIVSVFKPQLVYNKLVDLLYKKGILDKQDKISEDKKEKIISLLDTFFSFSSNTLSDKAKEELITELAGILDLNPHDVKYKSYFKQAINTNLQDQYIVDLLNRAMPGAPVIIYIDESDVLRERSEGSHPPRGLNELLAQIDGTNTGPLNNGVSVFAATNHPELMDLALKRAGRFEVLNLNYPSKKTRHKIASVKLSAYDSYNLMFVDPERIIEVISSIPLSTGAEIEQLIQEVINRVRAKTPGNETIKLDPAVFEDSILKKVPNVKRMGSFDNAAMDTTILIKGIKKLVSKMLGRTTEVPVLFKLLAAFKQLSKDKQVSDRINTIIKQDVLYEDMEETNIEFIEKKNRLVEDMFPALSFFSNIAELIVSSFVIGNGAIFSFNNKIILELFEQDAMFRTADLVKTESVDPLLTVSVDTPALLNSFVGQSSKVIKDKFSKIKSMRRAIVVFRNVESIYSTGVYNTEHSGTFEEELSNLKNSGFIVFLQTKGNILDLEEIDAQVAISTNSKEYRLISNVFSDDEITVAEIFANLKDIVFSYNSEHRPDNANNNIDLGESLAKDRIRGLNSLIKSKYDEFLVGARRKVMSIRRRRDKLEEKLKKLKNNKKRLKN